MKGAQTRRKPHSTHIVLTVSPAEEPVQLLAGDRHLRKSLHLYYLKITQSRIKIERFIFSFYPKTNKDGRKR